jgi:hypothetical protein
MLRAGVAMSVPTTWTPHTATTRAVADLGAAAQP